MTDHAVHGDSGFSLLEVMIAAGVLCGGVVTVAALLTGSARLMSEARHRSYATFLARAKIDELLVASQIGGGVGDGTDTVDGRGIVTANGIYTRRWWFVPLAGHAERLSVLAVEVIPRAPEVLHAGRTALMTIVERQP